MVYLACDNIQLVNGGIGWYIGPYLLTCYALNSLIERAYKGLGWSEIIIKQVKVRMASTQKQQFSSISWELMPWKKLRYLGIGTELKSWHYILNLINARDTSVKNIVKFRVHAKHCLTPFNSIVMC